MASDDVKSSRMEGAENNDTRRAGAAPKQKKNGPG